MYNEKIHIERIKRLVERQKALLHGEKMPVRTEYVSAADPIPQEKLASMSFKEIEVGGLWGKPWQSAWFRISGQAPATPAGMELGLWFDCDGEACVFKGQTPWQGLTPKEDWYHNAAKYFVPLSLKEGERVELLIEAAANDLFGGGKSEYRLRECSLVWRDPRLRKLLWDIELLLDLALSLPNGQTRRQRILYGLNRVCDLWNSDREACAGILDDLLAKPAHASALTAFSVGHAHLDLAWLWPLRETKRKGGRTFANALRLLERYPDYIFGASQAQLYLWMKELYPALYAQVKKRVAEGRWEVQGASWVEFDTNLISAESVIRQFMYGKRFFREEFGVEPDVLWLPDCFGFSGNLPQLMKGCGVEQFMTQKLSWNESNAFPHNLFLWEGIDGSRVLAQQLPTHDYNFSNNPSAFLKTEERFAQSEICDAFLNLYGIGDGGGGPTEAHLEYGLRQRDLEGVPKFRFARSSDYFEHLKALDRSLLPVMPGELYLEYHRGTYTTQARMKRDNARAERLLRAAEYLAALIGGEEYPRELRPVWQDTLLLQFHDIIPGSSIGMVYDDARAICAGNRQILEDFLNQRAAGLAASGEASPGQGWLLLNPSPASKTEWLPFPAPAEGLLPCGEDGVPLTCCATPEGTLVKASLPAWGVGSIAFKAGVGEIPKPVPLAGHCLENEFLRVTVTPQGSVSEVWDKESGTPLLASESNRLLLWEDEPNNWGAWDINHFYRTTTPTPAEGISLEAAQSYTLPGEFARLVQTLRVGSSILRQTLELRRGERLLRVSHHINWQEKHKMLRAHWYPDVRSSQASFGIQSGMLERSAKPRNAWEEARFEVPFQKFFDLSQADRGCAIFCADKFGCHVRDNEMDLNLLRSPADVDPLADLGEHEYFYAVYFHGGDYAGSRLWQAAEAFCADLLCLEVPALANPLPHSPVRLLSDAVTLDWIKPAESGGGLVVRLHECAGGSAEATLLAPSHHLWSVCDLLENPLPDSEAQPIGERGIRLSFKPFQIKTLLIK